MESDSKEFTLVLSIFKGVNFVVKKQGGLKCKLVCRVNDCVLESNIYHLLTSSTEPEFNYQAAWKLSRKELQELRLKREVVKIECHLVDKAGNINSIIGYCTISVKDAVEIVSYDHIDIKNSKLIPLKGTKLPWNNFGPKLQLILHFEDQTKGSIPTSKRKMVIPKSPTKKDPKFKAPLPPPPTANVPKFSWSINDEMGYFQLGNPGPNDDLYVMNITLVSVENLDQLLNQKSAALEDYQWRVRFSCFGMTIDSDIFTLNCSEENQRTYLGDKSTGRVRSSEKEFNRFLSEFVLEMKLETIRDEKPELQGTAWTELVTLLQSEIFEMRSMIDIVPEKSATIPTQCNPQLSHIIDVKKCPRFFANYIKLEEISFAGQNITTSKEDLSQLQYHDDTSPRKSIRFQAENEHDRDHDVDLIRDMHNLEISEVGAGDENSTRYRPSVIQESVKPEIEHRSSRKNKITVEEYSHVSTFKPVPSTGQSAPNSASTHSSSVSASTTTHTITTTATRKENLPVQIKNSALRESSSSTKVEKNLADCCPPGDYELSLKFSGFTVKAKVPLKDGWVISFYHPPLSVEVDDRSELTAKLKSVHDKVFRYYFDEEENECWRLTIPKFSSEILNTPLRVRFYSCTPGTGTFNQNESIGYADVPLGSVFTAKKEEYGRRIEGSEKIYRNSDAPIKIGYLAYEFTLSEKKDNDHYELDESYHNGVHGFVSGLYRSPELFTPVASESKSRDIRNSHKSAASDKSEPVRLDNEEKLFKEKLKEKEKAYLQMLSQEHKKQKEESEKAVNEKLKELEIKKKEYCQKLRSIEEREEKLKAKEVELANSTRTSSLESTKIIEELKLKMRRFEAEKKIEVDAINRRLDTVLTDLEIANGKILVLDKKMEAKDEEIFRLKSERGKWPETETIRKLDALEQENAQLKKELAKALEEKEWYRSQTQRIAKELHLKAEESQAQLRTENDNLKLQMLASREHELLNREIQQVANVSNEIRLIKDTMGREKGYPRRSEFVHNNVSVRARSRPGDGDFDQENIYHVNGNEATKDREQARLIDNEIERLTKSREGLLKTQAYTPHDILIKNIEAEILKYLDQKTELLERKRGVESKQYNFG